MNLQKHGSAAVKEGMTATVLMMLAVVFSSFIPFFGIFIYFAAIPFFVLARKYGFHFVLAFAFMAYIFTGVLIGFVAAIFDVLAPVLPAVLMGELSRLNRNQPEILAKGIAASLLCNLSAFAAQYFISGRPMAESMRQVLEQPIGKALESGEITMHTAQIARNSYEMILKSVPSIIFLWTIIVVLLVYYIGCRFLIKRGFTMEKYVPFRYFSFSRNLIFGSLILYGCAWIAEMTGFVDGQALYLNLFIILWFLFALQGTSVLTFFSYRMKISKILFAVMMGILCISLFGTIALFIAGLLDLLIDFRARSLQNKD